MKKIFGAFLFFFLTTLLTSCSEGLSDSNETSGGETDKKPMIAVSIVPQKTWVEAVVGDFAKVVVMIPPGKNPANYAPSPKELQQFSDADVYFGIGVPTEKVNVLSKAKDINPKMTIVHLEKSVAEKYPERQFESGMRDQHIWLSPKRAEVIVQEIADELSEKYPNQKDQFQNNAADYIEQISNADKEIRTILSKLDSKKFIVYHPAFGYFAEDYGLEMIAIEENGKEATPQRRKEIVNIAKKEGIRVIFYQAEIDSSQSKATAEEINGRTVQIVPLAPDYVENLKLMAQTFKEAQEL
ncbi:metal ABC transporter solute-binding protein, Zn/Mn family [Bacillus tuaregi]|uniref:metal ABC transporter solute-binding protein, Zn/Mn family n=1 Tax=Bacillus tuaregi TaxID=1816695 RepID=UPI000A046410|nr:zinc ABC transporter substrate-binding protein [Bacillus tuaregi]